MKLELVSHPVCPYVHRASIVLHEKRTNVDRKYVDLKNKPDWFLAISPRGKVPVLVADGVALFESSAICEFLDETIPPRMMSDDPFRRAIERAWVEVANDLLIAQYKAFCAPTEAEHESAWKSVAQTLGRYEEALGRGVISEGAFGLAHVAVAPALHRFVLLGDRVGRAFLNDTPRVEAWAGAVARRPSVAETVPDDFTELLIRGLAGSYVVRGHA